MRSIRLVTLLAVVVGALGAFTGSAFATSLNSYNTAFTGTSTNSSLTTSGGTVSCTNSTVTGTTPSGPAPILTTPINLTYSGCTAFGLPATVTVSPQGCLRLSLQYISATNIPATITIPAGCTITITIPAIGCTLRVSGPQTITGQYINGSPPRVVFTNAPVNYTRIAGGFGCPASGTGSLNGTYTVSPNIVVGP